MTQEEALQILKTGRSAFITGAAGAGKTHLLRDYIAWLNTNDIPVAITASTGIAATHMGGITIHAWSGVGIRDSVDDGEIDELCARKYLRDRIVDTQVLIIDEISMLHDFRLDMIDRIVRRMKGVNAPFGGIQVIFSGDFFQLPPITKRISSEHESQLFQDEDEKSDFAYHSQAWKSLNPAICYLHEQYRQDDRELLRVLNALRDRRVDADIRSILHTRLSHKESKKAVTKLYAKNVSVDRENDIELSKLPTKALEYKMSERGNPNICTALKKGCLSPEVLKLKVDAKVMFVKNNFDKKYVNGTQGTIISLSPNEIKVRTNKGDVVTVVPESWNIAEDGKIKGEILQYPLRLAWAITVHKSQGMSLDAAAIDLSDAFGPGMGYVALSRLRSLDGLHLLGISENAYLMHDEVIYFDEQFRIQSEDVAREIWSMGDVITEKQEAFIAKASNKKIPKEKKKPTSQITRELFERGMTLKQIAGERNLTIATLIDHLEKEKEMDPTLKTRELVNEIGSTKYKMISMAFHKVGTQDGGKRPLKPVFEMLDEKYDYDTLRIVRLCL